MDMGKLVARIKAEEACKLLPDQDSRGVWTIGWGHNLEAHMNAVALKQFLASGKAITPDQANLMLTSDINDAMDAVEALVANFQALSDNRQEALVDMCFNLGAHGLAGFHKMIADIEAGDFTLAAAELLNSKAAHELPGRYTQLYTMMKEG